MMVLSLHLGHFYFDWSNISMPALPSAVLASLRAIRAASPRSLPTTSLLHPFLDRQHVDVYETTIPSSSNLAPTDDIAAVARAFFRSPIFQAERMALGAAGFGRISDAAIGALDFDVGDRVVVFKVVARTPSQILFCWNDFLPVNGHTWLSLSDVSGHDTNDGHDHVPALPTRTIQFGSTFEIPTAASRLAVPPHLLYAQVVLASTRYALTQE
ncbi:Aste57867_9132 [Aphanomyces stellatus]|uniref:Aste57867_9132 protein n=1 Tax=Aphanomyces stellatus TaxID=120398 RepID=A0A485KM88_9STRA|nr:hypothetical protein As57867_009096 [Aphanomyces stellatus]VFT86016.1 Aste57867_9132 [Aphanomyces stellatus]